MVKKQPILRFARIGNKVITALLHIGFKLNALGYPMYLLTVRGRKSGLPRTTPIVVFIAQTAHLEQVFTGSFHTTFLVCAGIAAISVLTSPVRGKGERKHT